MIKNNKQPCNNVSTETYTGKEQSPKRFGLSAEGYDLNFEKEGYDGKIWIVQIKNNRKVWVRKNIITKITHEEPLITIDANDNGNNNDNSNGNDNGNDNGNCGNDNGNNNNLNNNYNVKINKNLEEFQQIIKKNIINNYKNVDINNIPISVVVSRINNFKIVNEKINKFNSLNELLDICICSSYIPYISGKTFSMKYKNNNYIDGGIFRNLHHFDCVDKCESSIYIHKQMAKRKFEYKDYFYLDKNTSRKLFNYGWSDCEKIYKK